ncbi:hypothetical protein E2C01_094033 [Portunus trituberculatus]|uniref:Uncharacterized protein n=1 Tax=Portunus trituberculatus TaxID=210409 RepID=A0A5B7JVV2_PORTR|nr:hypothetical protein [Portunus trituberculatus]
MDTTRDGHTAERHMNPEAHWDPWKQKNRPDTAAKEATTKPAFDTAVTQSLTLVKRKTVKKHKNRREAETRRQGHKRFPFCTVNLVDKLWMTHQAMERHSSRAVFSHSHLDHNTLLNHLRAENISK